MLCSLPRKSETKKSRRHPADTIMNRNRCMRVALVGCAAFLIAGCGDNKDSSSAESTNTGDPIGPSNVKPLPKYEITSDARVILERMVSAYKKLGSLQVRTEADILAPGAKALSHQSTILKFLSNPPRLSMQVKDPTDGTRKYYADGKTVVQYLGISNEYTRRTVKPNLPDIIARIDHDDPQVMSPLVFLSSGSIPPGIEAAEVTDRETINGKKTVVLKGKYSEQFMKDFGKRLFKSAPASTARDFTLWVDETTYFLAKSSISLGWSDMVQDKTSQARVVNPRIDIQELVVEIVPNPTFNTEEFRFFEPKGVIERFISGEKSK